MQISQKRARQTHGEYPLILQWVGMDLGSNFREKQMDWGSPKPNTDSSRGGWGRHLQRHLENEATDFVEKKGSRSGKLRNEPTERDRTGYRGTRDREDGTGQEIG